LLEGIRLVVSQREEQSEEALRWWQPLFERSEFVGCHSKADVDCPLRNAAGEFFLCELYFFSAKKESGGVFIQLQQYKISRLLVFK